VRTWQLGLCCFANGAFSCDDILAALARVVAQAPFRRMVTPGGFVMSVAMTNCGVAGWVSDRTGYRYDRNDPESDRPWPQMPDAFMTLASESAGQVGYADFTPDACLINCYEPGSRLSLIKTKTNGTSHTQSFQSRSDFPPSSCSEDQSAPIR
jgi:DNA alkylation damage repair protein AlkB